MSAGYWPRHYQDAALQIRATICADVQHPRPAAGGGRGEPLEEAFVIAAAEELSAVRSVLGTFLGMR